MNPKLRAIEAHPIQYQNEQMILLRDPLQLSETQIAVPRPLAPLLVLMDGTRDEAALEAALQVRAQLRLAPGLLAKLLADLDSAYLLENENFAQAKAGAIQAFRDAPSRPLSTVDGSGGGDPDLMAAYLQNYVDDLPPLESPVDPDSIRGLISPHIDYQRGGPVYAEVWRAAEQAARQAELVVILGTDHQGSESALTLTRQSYATPWGLLPTDQHVVDALARELGEEAFDEELHHRSEHSIELAAIWLHFVRGGEPVPLLPILCGGFHSFVHGDGDPASHEPFEILVETLRPVMASRRTLVVAAADLAHVGPAFGGHAIDLIGKAQLRNADERLLETVRAGDAQAFFENLKAEGDRRNVCGLPPIYLTLKLLDGTAGQRPVGTDAGYDLCPADPQGMSWVTIAGVILR